LVSDDDVDRSEEQFAASLEEEADEQFGSATLEEAAEPENDHRVRAAEGAVSGIERRVAEERALEQQAGRWRDEIAERLEGYRQKRSKKQLAGEFSMRFDWEVPAHSRAAHAVASEPVWDEAALPSEVSVEESSYEEAGAEPEQVLASSVMDEPVEQELPERKPPETAPPPRRLRHTNLIQFPRLPFMPPPPDELAEPVMDRPRILDVPDEIVQELAEERTPLSDIALEPQTEEPPRQPEFDVPPQVAPLPLRFAAALIDAVLVGIATAVFLITVEFVTPGLPHNRMAIAVGLAAPSMLWALYQYTFLVYGSATLGMRVTHLQVQTFAGEHAACGRRRARALAMMLSFMPLGLGIAWAFADEDMLCWHDRITRTYLARG
jgi:uncharacterized RDD family membrane protein YckC